MPTSDVQYQISQRAYEIWEEEGRPDGREAEHWRRAESEILGKAGSEKKTGKKTTVGGKKPAKGAKPSKAKKSRLPDDLTRIKGIGKAIVDKLNAIGVTTYAQIAGWKRKDIGEVNEKLALKGRIDREEWVKQAKKLAKR